MSERKNEPIRTALRLHDVRQWELAKWLGIGESTLCIRLRSELPPAEQRELIKAIEAIAEEKKTV